MFCPVCKEESFPKKKLKTEGWKVVGEAEYCALCGAEWKKEPDSAADPVKAESKNRLAALLGSDLPEKVELAGSADICFCRNCRYFIVHPFKSVCSLTDEETDPMGECGKFEKAEPLNKK
jgi:hypothetical protein